jgi:hypothetical protein
VGWEEMACSMEPGIISMRNKPRDLTYQC